MNKFELKELLSHHGIIPNKKLGQNFLYDPNSLLYIANQINIPYQDMLIEIGPGPGNLTAHLIEKTSQYIGIEYDHRFVKYLKYLYRDHTHAQIIQADAARVDIATLHQELPYHCVGNLPYGVAAIIISRLCKLRHKPKTMVILVQKETADRLLACPECKAYGSLSVLTQSLYDIKFLRNIPATVFWPVPHVNSSLLTMTLRNNHGSHEESAYLSDLARSAFMFRRKKLINVLKLKIDAVILDKAWQELALSHDLRADHLSVEAYIKLTKFLIS